MKKWILIFSVILLACGAAVYFGLPSLPPEAEGNRQKLEAARFLIDNMPFGWKT